MVDILYLNENFVNSCPRPAAFDERPNESESSGEEKNQDSDNDDDLFVNTNHRFCGDSD